MFYVPENDSISNEQPASMNDVVRRCCINIDGSVNIGKYSADKPMTWIIDISYTEIHMYM